MMDVLVVARQFHIASYTKNNGNKLSKISSGQGDKEGFI